MKTKKGILKKLFAVERKFNNLCWKAGRLNNEPA